MKRLQRGLIFLLLTTLIASPPLFSGYFHLSKAISARDRQTASAEYEAAARLLFWRSGDLSEKSGLAALEAQDAPRAIRLFLRARELGNLSSQGQAHLGEAYLQTGEETQALHEWQSLINEEKAPGEVFPNLAGLYHQRGETELEAAALRQWLGFDPTHSDANERLGRISGSLRRARSTSAPGNSRSRLPENDLAPRKADDCPENPCRRPRLPAGALRTGAAELGEWRLAQAAFSSAVNANPGYASAWAWLGLARQENQAPGAQAALETALKLDGNSAPLRAMLGTFWLRAGQPQKARTEFERATQLEPANPAWWLGLAGAKSQTDLSAALATYLQAVKLAPEAAENWAALAAFCVENHVYLEEFGLPAALKATELEPENPAYLDLLGRAHQGLGQWEAAEGLFNRALAAETNNQGAIYHFHLGLLYLQTDRSAQAKTEFEQTVKLNPLGNSGQQAKNLLERYFR